MTSNINGVSSYSDNFWYAQNINHRNNSTSIMQQISENKFNNKSYANNIKLAMSSYLTSLGSYANALENATSQMIASNSDSSFNKKAQGLQENKTSININKVQLSPIKADIKDKNNLINYSNNSTKSDIKKIVNSYNNLMTYINTNSNNFNGAQKLGYELGNIINSKKSPLESIGVTINKDGTLTIDDNKFDNSIKNSSYKVEDIFKGYNGIAEKLNTKSNEVISTPSKYSKPSELNNGVNDYYNYISSTYKLPYSMNFNAGLILNTMA
jgi:flagellar capping protein FliD